MRWLQLDPSVTAEFVDQISVNEFSGLPLEVPPDRKP